MKNRYWLINIPAIQFIIRVLSAGNIYVLRIFLLLAYLIKLTIGIPFAALQHLIYNTRVNKTIIDKPPVFILGHYRSGTTWLQKLLASDPHFGFLRSYDIVCPGSSLLFGDGLRKILQVVINIFKLKTRFFNNVIPDLKEPAEEDRYLINKGSAFTDYWRFVFPLNWSKWSRCSELLGDPVYFKRWKKEYLYLLKLITFTCKGKQLVLKSPPNTERIKYLLELFPHAKFVYINRNPYHVFYSACNMWHKAITRFRLQKIPGEQIEEIVFSEYAHLSDAYEENKKLISPQNLVEIKYEDLELNTLAILERIYTKLHLHNFRSVQKEFTAQVEKERKYQKFKYEYSEAVFQKIESRWSEYICRWKEKIPEITAVEYAI